MSRIIPLFHTGNSGVVCVSQVKGDSGRRIVGAQAAIVTGISKPWCLIADHPDNESDPVLESFDAYAIAICDALGMRLDEFAWFGLGQDGRYRCWDGAELLPVGEPPHEEASRRAFEARLSRLGARYDGNSTRMMLDAVEKPYMPVGGMHLN